MAGNDFSRHRVEKFSSAFPSFQRPRVFTLRMSSLYVCVYFFLVKNLYVNKSCLSRLQISSFIFLFVKNYRSLVEAFIHEIEMSEVTNGVERILATTSASSSFSQICNVRVSLFLFHLFFFFFFFTSSPPFFLRVYPSFSHVFPRLMMILELLL